MPPTTATWRSATLLDLVHFKRGFDITRADQRDGPYPVVSSSGIKSHHSEAKVPRAGVVIGRKGTLGTVHFIERPHWPHDTTLWVTDFKGNDPRYAYYTLKTLQLERFDVGSSNPTLNRNHIHTIEIEIPPLATQRRIAGILSAYDDLIENNTKRIKILEEMARALYREWFVHFRFPGHEKVKLVDSPLGQIPEGWEVVELGDVVDLVMGNSPKGSTYNDEGIGTPLINGPVEFGPRFTKAVKWTTAPSRFAKNGDLIVCVRGSTTGRNVKSDGEYCLGRGVCAISSPHQTFADELFKAELPRFLAATSGSTFPSWSGPVLKSQKVVRPAEGTAARFEVFAAPLTEMILVLDRQIASLRETRDLLLPRLISGQLDVANLDLPEAAQ